MGFMLIKTKSILSKKSKEDGLRICIMRHVRPEYDFDLWMPKLAPSERLLQQYVLKKQITWKEFEPKFLKQLQRQTRMLKFLKKISQDQNITLLCVEEAPTYCHRRLVAEAIQRLNK